MPPASSERDSPKKEKWGKHNVFTNNVEAPSYMVNLPENGEVKQKIFDGLRPILEEWAGVSWKDDHEIFVFVHLSRGRCCSAKWKI